MSSRSVVTRARSKVAAARRMPRADRSLFVTAWLALVGVTLSMRVVGFQRMHGLLSRRVPQARGPVSSPGADSARVLAATRLVDVAARNTGLSHTCLHRSLVSWWLMRRRGFDVVLKLGARRCEDGLEAHAWVEHAGVVVNDPEAAAGSYTDLSLEPIRRDA